MQQSQHARNALSVNNPSNSGFENPVTAEKVLSKQSVIIIIQGDGSKCPIMAPNKTGNNIEVKPCKLNESYNTNAQGK